MLVEKYKEKLRGILDEAMKKAGFIAEVIDPAGITDNTAGGIECIWEIDFVVRVQLGKLSLQSEFVSQTLKDA